MAGKCDAEPVTEYLLANGVQWAARDPRKEEGDSYSDLRLRRGVIIDEVMWQISSVDASSDSVILVQARGGANCTATIAQVRAGLCG